MRRVRIYQFVGTVASMMVFGSCFLWFVYRPSVLNWGATPMEVARVMPGDSVISDATFSATRAVTVDAGAEFVWPWLVQIGYRRAGLYSFDFLDNDGIPSAESILPHFQNLQVGDSIPIGPGFYVEVAVLEPDRFLLLVFPDWAEATWAWGLYPDGPDRTRLVTRLRGRPRGWSRLFADLGEIFPMWKSMLTIKDRAEALEKRHNASNPNVVFRSDPFAFSINFSLFIRRLRKAWPS